MSEEWNSILLCKFNSRVQGIIVCNNDDLYFTLGREGLWKKSKNSKPQLLVKDPEFYMMGITYDRKNNLYICDNQRILQYDIKKEKISVLCGKEVPKLSEFNFVDGNFNDARFITLSTAIDMDKNDIIVSDATRLRRISIEQQTVTTIPISSLVSSIYHMINGIKVTDDTIYLCESSANSVQKINKDGIASVIVGGKILDKYQFKNPTAIILDTDGTLIVSDDVSLKRVDPENNSVTTIMEFDQNLHDSKTVKMDHRGNLYIGCLDITKWKNTWKYARFMWIAKMKEDPSYCIWARLPIELVREITTCIRSGTHDTGIQSDSPQDSSESLRGVVEHHCLQLADGRIAW